MADANIDVPVIGNVKKTWMYAGVALLVGIVGYAYLKNRSSGGSAATDVGVGSANPDAFQGAALPMSAYDAYGNLVAGQSTTGPPANWALQAVDYLSNVFGYDRQTAGLAVSAYVNGGTLTQAQADMVGIARAVLGNSPDNLPVKITPAGTTTTTTPPPDTTSTDPMYQPWDIWQAAQVASGAFKSDPGGGLDWGVIARNSFGASANPTRVEVFARAQQMQSLNPDAAKRYTTYVPANVASSLRVS